MCIGFFQDHVLAEASRRVRAESDLTHIQAGRGHLAVFAVGALVAWEHAVTDDLVSYSDGGNARADLNGSADPFVARCVWCDIVTAFRGLALEALDVGLADAAGDQFDQDLIILERGQFDLFDSEVIGAVHESSFAFCWTIIHGSVPFFLYQWVVSFFPKAGPAFA